MIGPPISGPKVPTMTAESNPSGTTGQDSPMSTEPDSPSVTQMVPGPGFRKEASCSRLFSFATGVSIADRNSLADAIEDLGGASVLPDVEFVPALARPVPEADRQSSVLCPTHLVVDIPTRSEKFLIGVIVVHS